MKNREIEIQLEIENVEPLLKLLKAKAKFISDSRQIDDYYNPPERDFTAKRPIDEWLRIRYDDGIDSITYKNWHHNALGKSNHCNEFETVIEDGAQLAKILEILRYKKLVRVNKKRRNYRFQDYQISIDEIKDLGHFVEIEYKGYSIKHPDEIAKEMVDFINAVGVGQINRNYVGYPYMLLFPNEVKKEII